MDDAMVKVSDLAEELHGQLGTVMHRNPYMASAEEPVELGDNYGWYGWHSDAGDDPAFDLVTISSARWGDYDSSAVYHRANFNALDRDYPDTFITIGHSSHDGQTLALPMAAEIPEGLADILRGLCDYPIYDTDEMSRIEMQIVDESWDSWVEYDLKREMENMAEDRLISWEILDNFIINMEPSETSRVLCGIFMETVSELDAYPDFETADSCTYRDFDVIAAAVLTKVTDLYVAAMTPDLAVAGQTSLEVQ